MSVLYIFWRDYDKIWLSHFHNAVSPIMPKKGKELNPYYLEFKKYLVATRDPDGWSDMQEYVKRIFSKNKRGGIQMKTFLKHLQYFRYAFKRYFFLIYLLRSIDINAFEK